MTRSGESPTITPSQQAQVLAFIQQLQSQSGNNQASGSSSLHLPIVGHSAISSASSGPLQPHSLQSLSPSTLSVSPHLSNGQPDHNTDDFQSQTSHIRNQSSGLSPPPSSQPTYGAITSPYRSRLQTSTAQIPSQANNHLPLFQSAQPAPFRGISSLTPQLNTTTVNQARQASAIATLPHHRHQSLPRRGRSQAVTTPRLPKPTQNSILRCINAMTGEITITVKVYPPLVSLHSL